jgi:hypothetical protein
MYIKDVKLASREPMILLLPTVLWYQRMGKICQVLQAGMIL